MMQGLDTHDMGFASQPVVKKYDQTRRWGYLAILSLLLILSLFVGLMAADSVRWPMVWDTPLLHYAGYLMHDHHKMPYRDIFETSMPGTFIFHGLLVSMLGFNDFEFRCVDVALLCALSFMTFRFMRRFGFIPAWASFVGFAYSYLSFGPTIGLQRDYLGVIFLAGALLCIPATRRRIPFYGRYAAMALLFSCAALIKPHLIIGGPVMFITMMMMDTRTWTPGAFLRLVTASGAAFMLPMVVCATWLWHNNAWEPFLQMLLHYLPLHQELSQFHRVLLPEERWSYLLRSTLELHNLHPLFFGALAGIIFYACTPPTPQSREKRWSLRCVGTLLLLYALYPTIAGKFWDYHYMPFVYFASLGLALLAGRVGRFTPTWSGILLAVCAPICFFAVLGVQFSFCAAGRQAWNGMKLLDDLHCSSVTRADQIADCLKHCTPEGARIQPLDWTSGAIHGMLKAERPLATRFLYDYHFYHHTNTSVNKSLRAEFMDSIRASPPDCFIDVNIKYRVSGPQTADRFPELEAFLREYYVPVFSQSDYVIFKRREKE